MAEATISDAERDDLFYESAHTFLIGFLQEHHVNKEKFMQHHNNSHHSEVFHDSPVGVLQLAGLLESDDAGQGLKDVLDGLEVHRQLLHRQQREKLSLD